MGKLLSPGYVKPIVGGLVGLAVVQLSSLYVQNQRETDLRDRCRSHMYELGLSVIAYRESHSGAYPRGTVDSPALPPDRRLGWITSVSSYFDESQGFSPAFDRSAAWDSRRNLDAASPRPGPGILSFGQLRCPAAVALAQPGESHYVGITGLGPDSPGLAASHPRAGVFAYDRVTHTSDIKDGLAQTMMLAETVDHPGPWPSAAATLRPVDPARIPYLGPGRPFGGSHPGGAHVVMADGSVQFLATTTAPRIIEDLSTIAGTVGPP